MARKKDESAKRNRSKKFAVIALAALTTIFWLVLMLIKILVSHQNGDPLNFMDVLSDIGDNILGILPPIILIDFAFEYVTQKYVSEEMSETITDTLMSNPETIRLFEEGTRRNFLNATIDSLAKHGKLEEDMAENAITPYLTGSFNLRRNFHYTVTLRTDPISPRFPVEDYITLYERLGFEKHFVKDKPLGQDFGIGFFVENAELDNQLRDQTYLMQEDLSIRPEDLQALCAITNETEKLRFITEEMHLQVWINNEECEITSVVIKDTGILVMFHSGHSPADQAITVDISFHLPQLKTARIFQAVIAEPTYDVYIRLDYPLNYKIKMCPYFNGAKDARVKDANHGVGSCDILLRNKWVYPRSGAVFYFEEQ